MNTKRLSTFVLIATALLMMLSAVSGTTLRPQAATPEPTKPPTPTIVPTQMLGGEGCAASHLN